MSAAKTTTPKLPVKRCNTCNRVIRLTQFRCRCGNAEYRLCQN